MLARTPRSGFEYLGSGRQSVAEHSYRTAVIGYALGRLAGADADADAVVCLFHDLPEARVTDLHHLAKRYATMDERGALEAATRGVAFGEEILESFAECKTGSGVEAQLARDADRIELLLALKELLDLGNTRASGWMDRAEARLETDVGRAVAQEVRRADFDRWWRSELEPESDGSE